MWRTVGVAGFLGIEILLALALGRLGGGWLDRKLGTAPWFLWIGTALGVGAAIHSFARVIRDYKKTLKDDDASQSGN